MLVLSIYCSLWSTNTMKIRKLTFNQIRCFFQIKKVHKVFSAFYLKFLVILTAFLMLGKLCKNFSGCVWFYTAFWTRHLSSHHHRTLQKKKKKKKMKSIKISKSIIYLSLRYETTTGLSLIILIEQVTILTKSWSIFLMATTDPVIVSTAAIYVRLSLRFLFYQWESLLSDNLQNFYKISLSLETSYCKAKKDRISQCTGPHFLYKYRKGS